MQFELTWVPALSRLTLAELSGRLAANDMTFPLYCFTTREIRETPNNVIDSTKVPAQLQNALV